MRNRRACCYVSDISGNNSENARTLYLLTAVVRIARLRGGDKEFSFRGPRVHTYKSNFLTHKGTSDMEGTPLAGGLMATFDDYADASSQTWKHASISDWRFEGMGPPAFSSDLALGPWSWAPLPTIGASGYYAEKTTIITGITTYQFYDFHFA